MDTSPRLKPAPIRPPENDSPVVPPAGMLTIESYLALRGVPERRRAARRALAGELHVATVEEFDRLFDRLSG